MMSLSNPWGFLALLGIPTVLLIHFLQRKSRKLPISTLFLLDQCQRENLSGQRFERLKSSLPLWLQLLMVLGLAWLLVGPQWLEQSSVQRVVVVLDGSASMVASKTELETQLPAELRRLQGLSKTTEVLVLDSRLKEEQIFRGTDLDQLQQVLKKWQPGGGSHDVNPALRLGRSLADREGTLLLVTDHVDGELALEAKRLALGKPAGNVGFAGIDTEVKDGQLLWKATVKNYGKDVATREWWTSLDGKLSAKLPISLAGGQMTVLQGLFPAEGSGLVLHCTPDAFSLDDTLPAVKEIKKVLPLKLPAGDPTETAFYSKLFGSLPDVKIAKGGEELNVEILAYDPLNPLVATGPAILIIRDNREKLPVLTKELLVEAHPLMDGLNFQSLVVSDSLRIPIKPKDEVLMWQGDRAMIALRGGGKSQQLILNFDLMLSNARKLPALVVLLHRFLESLRESTPMPSATNVDCNQSLTLAVPQTDPTAAVRLITAGSPAEETVLEAKNGRVSFRAPELPSIFQVKHGNSEILLAASSFADAREADLSKNASQNEISDIHAASVKTLSKEDKHWRLWMLAVLGMALASWSYLGRKQVLLQ